MSKVMTRGQKWRFLGVSLVISILLVELIIPFGITFSIVHGNSMHPTLKEGDRLLVNRLYYLYHAPRKGDVITFEDPRHQGRYLVKRVVGLPGDVIEIKDGFIKCNGTQVTEQYIDSRIEDGNYGPIRVKTGTVFVMGDNRQRYASRDSRNQSIGLVPFRLIKGKVEWIL